MKADWRPKHIVVIDFETYYDKDYSLSKMTTAEYILDPRFEVIGMGISIDGKSAHWVTDFTAMQLILKSIPWEDTLCIAHNAIFDGAILEWKFGYKPAMYLCSMMGSRPYVAPWKNGMSLKLVAEFLGVGQKGDEVAKFIGYRRHMFTPAELAAYGRYCCQDAMLSGRIGRHVMRNLPWDEMRMIDLTIKKFTRPQLQLDPAVIEARLEEVKDFKIKALLKLPPGVGKDDLMSNDKLAKKLGQLGVTPPRKLSAATGRVTWAFAKTDEGVMALKNHSDERVRNIIEARLLWKSTQEETRLDRFFALARLSPWLAVPLLWYGAHTGRLSGYDSLNLQNLPRPEKGVQGLRHALVAPDGHKVVTIDLSQIEARIVATLAGQWDLVNDFAKGVDIYSKFASIIYGYPVNKKDHPTERFVGKTCILGLGYGMGADRLFWTLIASAAKYGIQLNVTIEDCQRWVKVYRETYTRIPALWKTLDKCLKDIAAGTPAVWQMLKFTKDTCELPNGMHLHYPNCRISQQGKVQFDGFVGKSRVAIAKDIWGGMFLENISQALAQIIIKGAELKISIFNLYAALQVHDELVYVVRDAIVDRVKRALQVALLHPIPWMPKLPLACEVGVGQSYGEAK